jgi:hypothetical protein
MAGDADCDAGTTDSGETDAEIESDGLADAGAAAVLLPAELVLSQPAVAAISAAVSAAAGRNARIRRVKASPALAEVQFTS